MQLEDSAVVRACVRMDVNSCIHLYQSPVRRAQRRGGGDDGDVNDLLKGALSLAFPNPNPNTNHYPNPNSN